MGCCLGKGSCVRFEMQLIFSFATFAGQKGKSLTVGESGEIRQTRKGQRMVGKRDSRDLPKQIWIEDGGHLASRPLTERRNKGSEAPWKTGGVFR